MKKTQSFKQNCIAPLARNSLCKATMPCLPSMKQLIGSSATSRYVEDNFDFDYVKVELTYGSSSSRSCSGGRRHNSGGEQLLSEELLRASDLPRRPDTFENVTAWLKTQEPRVPPAHAAGSFDRYSNGSGNVAACCESADEHYACVDVTRKLITFSPRPTFNDDICSGNAANHSRSASFGGRQTTPPPPFSVFNSDTKSTQQLHPGGHNSSSSSSQCRRVATDAAANHQQNIYSPQPLSTNLRDRSTSLSGHLTRPFIPNNMSAPFLPKLADYGCHEFAAVAPRPASEQVASHHARSHSTNLYTHSQTMSPVSPRSSSLPTTTCFVANDENSNDGTSSNTEYIYLDFETSPTSFHTWQVTRKPVRSPLRRTAVV